jgi:chromosome segregation protein
VRLERLALSPYGRFADRALSFRSDAALHVVLGANESGKTTTLSAIGDLLFGFPARTTYDFAHEQRLLRVGGALRLANGAPLELRRRKGNKNTLVDAADQPISDDALQGALGLVDRKVFESEFGLTAQALRDGGEALLKAGGGLAETLAASSAGLGALSRLRERLSAEADALFTTRRSGSKTFYLALDRHEEADRRLRDSVVTADALKGAEAAVVAAKAREVDLKARHDEAGRSLARWQRARRTYGKLGRLDALAREAEAFADLAPAAARTLAEARAALAEEKVQRVELERFDADEAADQAAIAALGFDSDLLAQGAAIDALREKLGAVRKARDDLPRRVEAHNGARATLDDLARRLGLPDHAALLAAPPTDAAIARARALMTARRRAEEKHAEALAARDKALAERDRLRGSSDADAADPELFKRRLASMADVVADAERLRRERASSQAEALALAEETARLDPAVGEMDVLARLPLPDETAIAARGRQDDEIATARASAEIRLAAAVRAVETGETALAKRAVDGAGATRADWLAARDRRSAALDRLGVALDSGPEERRDRLEVLGSLIHAADMTAEALLADTDRAARLEADREALVGKREDLKRVEAEVAEWEIRRERALGDWRALWAPSGITPHSPPAMARWRERVAGLLARRADLGRRRADIEALAPKIEGARASIVAWLAEFDETRAKQESFEEAHRAARSHLEAMQAAWMRAREVQLARGRADKDLAEAETAVERETAAREKYAAEWPAAMAGVSLGAQASVEEAEAALKVWDAVAAPRAMMAREERSIVGIEEDIASFDAGVAAIVAAGAPTLTDAGAAETLARLVAMLTDARRAHDERERLRKAVATRAAARRKLDARQAALGETLARAMTTLGASDLPALAATLDRHEQRQALETDRASLRRDLAEIADNLDEAALRAEQAEIDVSLAPSHIELAEQTLAQLLHEISEARAGSREAEAKLETLSQGRDAAGAARDRQEAAGELIDIAERWIARQAAARLAARAIERHRAAAQDPLVARAGALFAIATAGGFSGLGTDYDDGDRPVLVARRDGGAPVRIEGLSEGARDQLFLSLRLALLERRAGEPLPFIGDDILASFDDERTTRTLGLLAEFGAKRQVIVFTHHRHVAEIARAAGASIDVIEM